MFMDTSIESKIEKTQHRLMTNNSLCCFYIMILSCIAVTKHERIIVLKFMNKILFL